MAFGATAMPKGLTALLFLSFLLIHVNRGEIRECWGVYNTGPSHNGLWCMKMTITDKPGECIVAGSSFTLRCRLEVDPHENAASPLMYGIQSPLSMVWSTEGKLIGEKGLDVNKFSYLKVKAAQIRDSGYYYCQTYWLGQDFVKGMYIDVQETTGKVTANPSSIRVKLHDSATLTCHVKGHSPSNLIWKHTGILGVKNVTNFGKYLTINNTDRTMTLHLNNVSSNMGGIYECRARICSTDWADSINVTVFGIPKVSKVHATAVGASRVCLNWTLDDSSVPTKLSAVRRKEERTKPSPYVETSISSSSLPELQNASIVDNLNNSTTYMFEVVFNTSAGDSFTTYSEWVTTLDRDFDFVPKLAIEGATTNSIEVRALLPPVELLDLVSYYELTLTDGEGKKKPYQWKDIRSTYTVANLKKGTHYKLQVATCNACLAKCGNRSDAEEVSTAAKELDFIPQIQVKATTNNSISVGWEKPSLAQYYQISQYKMEATSGDDKTGTIELNRTADSYVFQNLKSNITYEIQITVCIFGSGKCKDWSGPVKADTINPDPGFVPAVSVCGTTSDSVQVVWTTPPEEQRNPVQQYKVEATNKNETQGPVFLRNDMSSHTFGNLTSGTTYQLRVAACSIDKTQCGDWSEAKNATTIYQDPDPDSIPQLEIEGVTLDSIDIRAPSLPAKLQGWVDYYRVMVTDSEEGIQSHNWTNIDSTFSMKNLTSETSYRLRVATCNTCLGKCGNWSDETEVSTAGKEFNYKANISVKATKTDSIKIGWNEPSPAEMYQILRYIVRATSENGTRKQDLDRRTVSFIFEHLQPNATYEFGLTVCIYGSGDCDNNYQSAAVRADARNRDPIFVPSVSVDKTTYDSVWVVWTMPPEELRDRVARYKVQANNGTNETRGSVSFSNDTNSYVLGGLEPQTTFQFQVAACGIYEEQCGNWSIAENGTTIAQEVVRGQILWPSLVAVALVIIVAMGVCMFRRKQREMALRREFIEATLQRFNRGALDSMDLDSDVAAQAELLPYDKKWEFPRELLTLDKILGQGAFGVVRKAEARSICKGQKFTIVAVKLVRATARLHCMTALTRELKILANLGKHLNIVNLLGACTKNVPYGELLVIVEFCRFGNLRDLLLSRRSTFVDQFATTTNQITADSNSSAGCDDASNTSDDSVSNDEPTELDPQSKYQGDYLAEDLEPICTQDLLSWAWQVTRGMDYLGSKKILHGDLAARNILLADHNVVKICDFGMARHLDKDDSYHKKGQEPLPVKWMAIESLRDRVFSIQSDIWSFGIVLWEFFTLGQTPYIGTIDPERLYQKLSGGYRLAQPEYANSYMYQLMLDCWDADPSMRPSFKVLSGCIGDVLEEGVKMHYMELSRPLDEMNAELTEIGTMDYLVMSPAELKSIAIRSTFGSTMKLQSERNTEIEIGNPTVEYKCLAVGDPIIHIQKPR